ncbi:MAG: hypothetical protein ACTSXF_09130 [Promethearchaeota archaeon]
MSYVPKYILKRMLPKDCVKKTDDGVVITFLNVISPITIEEIPDNPLDYIEFKIDGKELGKDLIGKVEISYEDKKVTINNIKDFIGETLPVGGKLNIFLPFKDLNSGEEHEFDILIKTDNPFHVTVKRTVQ